MNKFSAYILLVLVFLGLSKSFSPSEQRVPYIENEHVYSTYFQGAPLEIILIDYFKAGFILKTYFHRYKIVHGFKNPDYITVRVSKKFWMKNRDHIGMSLFRRREMDNVESILPLPPGSLFFGDPSFGYWEDKKQNNTKIWFFHRAYKNFPSYFGWEDFKPTQDFYRDLTIHIAKDKVFFGSNHEFGSKSPQVKKTYSKSRVFNPIERIHFRELITRFIGTPWGNKEK